MSASHIKTAHAWGVEQALQQAGYGSYADLVKQAAAIGLIKEALGLKAIQFFARNLGPEAGAAFLDKHHYRLKGIPQNFRREAPVARELPMPTTPKPSPGPSSKVIVDPSLFASQ